MLEAGLGSSLLVQRWLDAAEAALLADDSSPLPSAPDLSFGSAEPTAWSARLDLKRGEVLHLEIVPALDTDSARVFADLFFVPPTDSLPVSQRLWSDVAWT
ncbi:MAG: hypothetical protein AAFX41_10455, partial [Bacteroidota bacterium]